MNMSRSLSKHLRVRGDDLLTLHDQSDGLHAGVGEDIVAGKLGQALDAFKENVQDIRVVLGEDLAHSLEGQLHDVLVHVRCVEVEHQIKMIIDQPLKYIASSFKEEEALNLHCYKVLFNQMSDQSFESLPKSQY